MKRDPICGRQVDPLRARGVAIVDGERYYFCSRAHKQEFLSRRDPWDEPTPLPPVVSPEHDPTGPTHIVAVPRRKRRGFLAFILGLFRRYTL